MILSVYCESNNNDNKNNNNIYLETPYVKRWNCRP